jgi:hypothetical protein
MGKIVSSFMGYSWDHILVRCSQPCPYQNQTRPPPPRTSSLGIKGCLALGQQEAIMS